MPDKGFLNEFDHLWSPEQYGLPDRQVPRHVLSSCNIHNFRLLEREPLGEECLKFRQKPYV